MRGLHFKDILTEPEWKEKHLGKRNTTRDETRKFG